MAYIAFLPSVITLQEGQSVSTALRLMQMTNNSLSYSYYTTTDGGTASGGDISGSAGSGSISVRSTSGYNETVRISLGAVADDVTEDTETAYLVVETRGNMYFPDGSTRQVVELRILDNNQINGTSGNDVLRGTSLAETLTGLAGDDTYRVTPGDVVIEQADGGIDTVQSAGSWRLGANIENLILTSSSGAVATGNELANHLTGGIGDDTLIGGLGADTLEGGFGNDRYYVDDAADVVIEAAGAGTDAVYSSLSYALGANVENLALLGAQDLSATGNALANVIYGNAGSNLIDGGAGADTMAGGAGNDTYIVDSAGDRVVERAGAGIDLVRASVSHSLGANVENLTLTGRGSINGVGNALDNRIDGNAGANMLNGGAGADTMTGGAGNDIFIFDNTGDRAIELAGGGIDEVRSTVSVTLASGIENLTLLGGSALNGVGNALDNLLKGNAGANILKGGLGNDTLMGGAGNDILLGGTGADVLNGGSGADRFIFNAITDSGSVATGRDRVQDFSHAQGDKVDLRLIDADSAAAGDQRFHLIGSAGFSGDAGELRYQRVGTTTVLQGDVNGDGKADFSVSFDGAISFVASDFLL